MPIPDALQRLAPTDLIIYRKSRYEGGGFNVSLRDFAPEDAALILRLYSSIKKIYDLWLYMKDEPNYPLISEQLVKEFGSDQFRISAQAIGAATYTVQEPSPLMRKVMHDIRGGALTVLVGLSSFLKMMPDHVPTIEQCLTMVRDHAKLMRNAIEDIDPMVRMADESVKVHPISDFVNKWQNLGFEIAGKKVVVTVESSFTGNITSRCLETSAIDRILYNYINNAARFTADNRVGLTIFAVNDDLVRWVVQNSITPEQRQWLAGNVGDDLGRLFKGGLTRGGHGLGLSSCTDFVAASFGVEPDYAIEKGYLGARLVDDHFCGWFHWPAYMARADEEVCECAD
ncbi:MAG: ATP-binding protein [Anaerolineae bacterium]